MHSSTAGYNINLIKAFKYFRRDTALLKIRQTVCNSRSYRSFYGIRLFMDFFQHEMLVTALFSSVHIPVGSFKFLFNFRQMAVINSYARFIQYCYFTMFKQVVILCIFQNCRHIGSDKAFIFTDTYNQRTFTAYRINSIFKVSKNNTKCKRAFKLMHYFFYRFKRITVIVVIKKLSHNLRISLALKNTSLRQKKFLQRLIILNYTVMYDRNSLTAMRVGIDI